jgi:beta-lactamase regulating signal transducer with metallopeptidase domain
VWWTSTRVIVAAMALWSGVCLLRFLSAIRATRAARRRSRPFPVQLESALPHWRRIRDEGRQSRLVLSNSVTRAAVLGWGSPVIAVAPSLVRTLDADDLDRVLVHEWAHVQRHDDVVCLLQIAFRVAAGWHPAVWWIDRRLHVEREIACDEMAVAVTGSAKSYAECLMRLSGMKDTPQRVQLAPAVFARSGLRARVVKIVSSDRPIAPVWSRTLAGASVLMLFGLSAVIGGVTLVEATTFAAPVISVAARTLIASPDHPVAARSATSTTSAQRAPGRKAARASAIQRPTAEPSSPPQPDTRSTVSHESREPEPVAGADASDTTRATEAESQGASKVAIDGRTLPAQPPQGPPNVTMQAESPWTAAAASGSAIGRKSKEAGLATAGAFKRFAGRIAGSF